MMEHKDSASQSRSLLYLCSGKQQTIRSMLDQVHGWAVDYVANYQQAKGLLTRGGYTAALVHVEFYRSNSAFVERLLEKTQSLIWIVLVENKQDLKNDLSASLQRQQNIFIFPLSDIRQPVQLNQLLSRLVQQENMPQARPPVKDPPSIIGSSTVMRHLVRAVERLAQVDLPLLIVGESGTGKGLIARNVHSRSSRKVQTFLEINCQAVSDRQLAQHLFGDESCAGAIERAQGGTLLLNDISHIPRYLQRRLQRYLLEGVVELQHSIERTNIDTRIITTTSVDLYEEVRQGRFRQDLFYRLSALNIFVPPLRERGRDIEQLARVLFDALKQELASEAVTIAPEAMIALNSYSWPGNVTELLNRLRRALVVADDRVITADFLGLNDSVMLTEAKTLEQAREEAEAAVIRASMQRNHGNVSRAARELAVSRVTLYRLLNKYDLLLENNS